MASVFYQSSPGDAAGKLELRSPASDATVFTLDQVGECCLLLWLMSGRNDHWVVGALRLSCHYSVTVSGEVIRPTFPQVTLTVVPCPCHLP